jgi:hypothetical protein
VACGRDGVEERLRRSEREREQANSPSSSTYMTPWTLKLQESVRRISRRLYALQTRKTDAPDSLAADGAHLVAEAVRVPAVRLCSERVGAGVAFPLLVHDAAARSGQLKVDVEVSTAGDLVRDGHLRARGSERARVGPGGGGRVRVSEVSARGQAAVVQGTGSAPCLLCGGPRRSTPLRPRRGRWCGREREST